MPWRRGATPARAPRPSGSEDFRAQSVSKTLCGKPYFVQDERSRLIYTLTSTFSIFGKFLMSTSGNTHRGQGHGPSAVMDKPEPSAPRNTPPQGHPRPKLKRPSNQVMVLLIALAIFTMLISLPWILDTLQDEKGDKKTESAQTASNTSTPAPSQFANSAVGVDSRFGIPRAGQAQYPHSLTPPQSPMAAQGIQPPHSYQAIPMPMRPFAMPQHGGAEAGQRPAAVQHFVPMGRSIDSVSQDSEGEDGAHAAQHPGSFAVEEQSTGASQASQYSAATAPKPFSAPFESEGKRLPSSIQAPAEAMARLCPDKMFQWKVTMLLFTATAQFRRSRA